ncbi:hypothetical protein QOZ80_7BG0585030 [Eleusine coracana subsp. coracana]|nr:hypothetical protein QOZ80_7BG0585030 [Eleusine coracana subsp. coracana]
MAPPLALMEELVEEFLLRVPPDDPATLLSAALVCKPWCRLVCSSEFRRRFSEFHRRRSPPPVIGFFCTVYKPCVGDETHFVAATPSSFRRLPHAVMPNWRAVDALHGRVLFYDSDMVEQPGFLEQHNINMHRPHSLELHLIVWNPITREVSRLPVAPLYTVVDRWNAALVCATPGCDHKFDCAIGVVVVATVEDGITNACVYSSEQHAWGTPTSIQRQDVRVSRGRSARVVGKNTLYFRCYRNHCILEYNFCKQQLSFISLPSEFQRKCITLMTAEDGGLGFATIDLHGESKLDTWSREVGLDGQGTWVQKRVFELDKLLSFTELYTTKATATRVVAVVNAFSHVFIGTYFGISTVDLKFGQVRQIYECDPRHICDVVPYTTFCTPGT